MTDLAKPVAKYLVLAGDIGIPGHKLYDDFLQYTSNNWKHVFYVAGNHEYYDTGRKTTFAERHAELIESRKQHSNLHFLRSESPSYYIAEENIAIVGSTLWSHISKENQAFVRRSMNDYKYIRTRENGASAPITPALLSEKHDEEKKVLDTQIAYWETQKTDVVVITHHMPSFSLIGSRYTYDPLNCCFASHCESLMRPNVKAWVYGHTHNASSGMFGHTYVACNPRGYPNETCGFQSDRYFEFCPDDNEEALNPELAASALGIQNPEIVQLNA